MIDRDEAALAEALRDDYESLCADAHVPPAGLVWWRATVRARTDAARAAERPITAAQTFAAVCLLALAVGAVASTWHALPEVVGQHGFAMMLGIAVCLLVAPVAVLMALAE